MIEQQHNQGLKQRYTSEPELIFFDAVIPYFESKLIKEIINGNKKFTKQMKSKGLTIEDLPTYHERISSINEFMEIYVEIEKGNKSKSELKDEFSAILDKNLQISLRAMERYAQEKKLKELFTAKIDEFISNFTPALDPEKGRQL